MGTCDQSELPSGKNGYFITKEQLQTLAYRAMANAEHRLLTGDKHTETVERVLKDLGVE